MHTFCKDTKQMQIFYCMSWNDKLIMETVVNKSSVDWIIDQFSKKKKNHQTTLYVNTHLNCHIYHTNYVCNYIFNISVHVCIFCVGLLLICLSWLFTVQPWASGLDCVVLGWFMFYSAIPSLISFVLRELLKMSIQVNSNESFIFQP